MNKGILGLLALLALPVEAEEQEVYLLATVQLGGSNLAQSIFLHEPQITTLEDCQEAVRVGQRDRDWQRYHHIFMRDRFQGFTGHLDYRCVFSAQRFSGWNDRARYNQPYLISIDEQANLQVERMSSQAQCATRLKGLAQAQRAISRCSVGNQNLL
ncbi:hypothetical protein ACEVAQ_20040 [Ectopseudomonas khazarica]|uniref:Uncharacterized protein n=1 Tax=Ectopseudomonas khazarica TaxID=2502979 RepID=A0ABW7MIQ8_9GAMM|nr:hypothetical protein [Pseudomonas sp. REST10]WFC63598.1 hypothetical protein EWH21_18350 [Pseudomonas sp. REST10]|tara:strand:+ start:3561 stop:4028 length:468 start_codon:yes stop_codon:yes gene_type:complete